MTLIHRALFSWLIFLIFLILVCLKLEKRINWNWALICIPLWIYDAILIIYIIIKIIRKWMHLSRIKELLIGYQWYILAVFLKIAAQIMICLKLEYVELNIRIYFIFLPIWILLPCTIIYVFSTIIK